MGRMATQERLRRPANNANNMLNFVTRHSGKLAVAAVLIATGFAAQKVGYIFGNIIGASLSPLGSTVAPLVFGLLAVIGLAGGAARPALLVATLEKLPSFKELGV